MSDGSLSQDEIDALLQGTEDISTESFTPPVGGKKGDMLLSQNETMALQELLTSASVNVGGALGAMVSKNVKLYNPSIETATASDLKRQIPDNIVEVKMDYDSGLSGEHEYIIDTQLALVIAGLMMGQDTTELTEASLSAVSEALNTMCGNASTTIGNRIKKEIRTAPPMSENKNKANLSLQEGQNFVKVSYSLDIDGSSYELIEIFGLNVVKDMVSSMLPATNEAPSFGAGQRHTAQQPMMMGQQRMAPMQQQERGFTQVQNVQFANFSDMGQDSQGGNINLLMDVTMDLTVELGRTKRTIKYILGMGEGTVLELDKLAGEPVDILVNGKLIARGEVVVIDENFGVRVTEIISPADRLQELT